MNSLTDGETLGSTRPATALWFRRLSTVALVGYWLVMFTGTHWPNLKLDAYPENTDKALHLTGYAGFGFLLGLWFSTRGAEAAGRPFGRAVLGLKDCLWILAVIVGYSIFDEVSQIPVGRTCDFWDAVADWAGGLIGLSVFTFVRLVLWRLIAV
jgi:VanZ family protein